MKQFFYVSISVFVSPLPQRGSGSSTAVEVVPGNPKDVGSIPAMAFL